MGMREGSDPLALSRGAAIRGSCFFRFFARTRSRGCERVPTLSRSPTGLRFAAPTSFVSSHELAAEGARGFRPSRALPWDCDSWLLLFLFLLTNSQPGMREGSDPLALSRGAAIRGSCFFRFFARTRRRGSERVPTLSRSPVGLGFAAPASFVSSHELAAGGAKGFRPSRSLPWGPRFAAPTSFVSSNRLAAGDARGFRPSRALPWGCDSRLLLLLFLRTDSPPGEREGSVPLALSREAAIRGSLLLLFLPTNSPPRMREGSDPLALSRGTGIRGSCFFCFFEQTRSRGCERVPTLSRSPVGAAIRGFLLLSRLRSFPLILPA